VKIKKKVTEAVKKKKDKMKMNVHCDDWLNYWKRKLQKK